MESIDALRKFVSASKLKSDPFGRYWFEALVIVDSPKGTARERTQVRVSMASSENGAITLDEVGEISSEWAHCDFNPAFQTYEFDSATAGLVITGKSPKMGNYRYILIA